MQTLCHSVIRDHISLAGFFFRRGVIIFSYAEGKPRQIIQDLGSWRRRCTVGGDTCGRHAASVGSGLARKGAARWIAKVRVTRDRLCFSLLGSHTQQHLLCPHQHFLTLGWQFHSCGVTIGADRFVSASTPFLPRNCSVKKVSALAPNSLLANHLLFKFSWSTWLQLQMHIILQEHTHNVNMGI